MTTKEETAAYCDRQADSMRDSKQTDDHQHEKVWRDRAAELRAQAARRSVSGFLCFAYGESDIPCARLVETLAEVGQFFCEEWFGEEPVSMSGDTQKQYERALAGVHQEVGDAARDGCWETTFEIGGIWVRRAAFWKEGSNG